MKPLPSLALGLALLAQACAPGRTPVSGRLTTEPRQPMSYIRGPYNAAFFRRHGPSEAYSAGFHYHHGRQHDVLILTPLADRAKVDADFDAAVFDYVQNKKSKVGPTMDLYGPYVARVAWKLYRTIDWTHQHHEQTYDIMASQNVAWDKKKEWTDRAVKLYLARNKDVARSVAPLDVTMRRAACMMKPYFTYYRNFYPKSNSEAWVAHWWHPAVYEAQMISGNADGGQEAAIKAVNDLMFSDVYKNRPQRMILSRELMPRYSRMSPESANIFDNLHMLHGLAYDILAYEGWTEQQQRDELYRVIAAMSYQPGDEKYVRKFDLPYPDVDPRVYPAWMAGPEGSMSKIMNEMMDEMMPLMMPDMTPEMKDKMMAQFQMKMRPGLEPGEIEGSLHDAMRKLMPDMKMMPGGMEPGQTPEMMRDAMLKGWQDKHGNMPDVAPMPMNVEPTLSAFSK